MDYASVNVTEKKEERVRAEVKTAHQPSFQNVELSSNLSDAKNFRLVLIAQCECVCVISSY